MSDRKPPLARELAGVDAGYTWKYGEKAERDPEDAQPGGMEEGQELEDLRREVEHLSSALEDVVAIALSGADFKERAIMMHRRAVAALTGPPPSPPRPAEAPVPSERTG